ncbi:MAG: 8-oxo-dGTP diphosphatase [Spirochaetales bacterium]|nr:8-oxo-dGTP diphosphatase [Spirochaetales bacterium]
MILETIAEKYLWLLIVILAINLFQRKHAPRSQKKRIATLIIAVLAMVWQIFIVMILTLGWPHWLAIPALLVTIAIGVPLRRRILLFKFSCPQCEAKLNYKTILNFDDNLCDQCWRDAHPELFPEPEVVEEEETPFVEIPRTVEEIDWDSWEPKEVAVLLYLFEDDKVLLIDKKTGFGKGKVSAPGGHIEPHETASEAAIREFNEETTATVEEVDYKGTLEFQFRDGFSMRGYVFFAHAYEGTPNETEEARPFWCKLDELPYDKMWADDIHWLPLALEGTPFTARFIFEDEEMLSYQIVTE